ncbi:MAG: hypothetical protein ACXWLT_07925 [Rhizomicrobium sp.]
MGEIGIVRSNDYKNVFLLERSGLQIARKRIEGVNSAVGGLSAPAVELFFAIKTAKPGPSNNKLGDDFSSCQRANRDYRPRSSNSRPGIQFCKACEKMCPSSDHEKSTRDALATVQTAISRPSPKSKFDSDRAKPAVRVDGLLAQQRKFQELNELCDKAVAEIRASLERPHSEGS